jgi:hypothetical protein
MAELSANDCVPGGRRVDLPGRLPILPDVYQLQSHPQVALDSQTISFDIYLLLLDFTELDALKAHCRDANIPSDHDGGKRRFGSSLLCLHPVSVLISSARDSPNRPHQVYVRIPAEQIRRFKSRE